MILDYYYLPEEVEWEKAGMGEALKIHTGNLMTALFLIAAMIVLVMKGKRRTGSAPVKRQEELLMDYPGLIMKFTLAGTGGNDGQKGISENRPGLRKKEKIDKKGSI